MRYRTGRLMPALAAAAAMLVAGCANVEVARTLNYQKLTDDKQATPIGHLSGKNWGIYLTPRLPLISGNTRKPDSWFPVSFFRNNVKVSSVVDMVTAESHERGGTRTTDMSSAQASIWIVPIPFLWYKSVTVTANATK